jgi:hypothetical protein
LEEASAAVSGVALAARAAPLGLAPAQEPVRAQELARAQEPVRAQELARAQEPVRARAQELARVRGQEPVRVLVRVGEEAEEGRSRRAAQFDPPVSS